MKKMLIWKGAIAEFIGTFCLVFAGAGAVVINDSFGGQITHVGVALTFGFVVMAMIYSIGNVSGAHINPAVTLSFCCHRKFPIDKTCAYIVSQCSGACLASLVLKVLFVDHLTLGATLPAGPVAQSFVMELIATFILMFVILNVSTGCKEKGLMAGVAIGGTVALLALFAGPVCGASMNPARSLGPALISGQVDHHWLYWLAPGLGAFLAGPVSGWLQKNQ